MKNSSHMTVGCAREAGMVLNAVERDSGMARVDVGERVEMAVREKSRVWRN